MKKCPDDALLAAYIEGPLPERRRRQVESHLAGCPFCLDELITARSLVLGGESEPVPPQVTQAVVRLVKDLCFSHSYAMKQRVMRFFQKVRIRATVFYFYKCWNPWGLAQVRSARNISNQNCVHLKRKLKDGIARIDIVKIGANKAEIRVGLAASLAYANGTRITLKSDDREIASCLLGCGGHVMFEDISCGRYSLTVARNGLVLDTYVFEIGWANNGNLYKNQ